MSHERIKKPQYFIVLNFAMRLVRDGTIRNVTRGEKNTKNKKQTNKQTTTTTTTATKYSSFNDTVARISHTQNRRRSLFETLEHFASAQVICV
jgi:hypothetical protein